MVMNTAGNSACLESVMNTRLSNELLSVCSLSQNSRALAEKDGDDDNDNNNHPDIALRLSLGIRSSFYDVGQGELGEDFDLMKCGENGPKEGGYGGAGGKVSAQEGSSEARIYPCLICPRKFDSSYALSGHQNAHKNAIRRAQRSHMNIQQRFGSLAPSPLVYDPEFAQNSTILNGSLCTRGNSSTILGGGKRIDGWVRPLVGNQSNVGGYIPSDRSQKCDCMEGATYGFNIDYGFPKEKMGFVKWPASFCHEMETRGDDSSSRKRARNGDARFSEAGLTLHSDDEKLDLSLHLSLKPN